MEDKKCQSAVVVGLPYIGNRVLLQLRDDKLGIVFPGHWGFFGGAIEEGESAEDAIQREIVEEIGFLPDRIHGLGRHSIEDLDGLVAYAFAFPLTIPVEQLVQHEGQDMALVTLEEVLSKRMYSNKMQAYFPVVRTRYLVDTIRRFLDHVNRS